MIIVIPAYKPDEKLLQLIDDLKMITDADIITVDDGGKEYYTPIFEKCKEKGCTVLVHPENRGKGAAMKTAFAYILENYGANEVIVTADADGQHLPKDILNCLEEAKMHPDDLILGGRNFKGNVPMRSILGNAFSRWTFRFLMRQKVYDTQTGLRAFSASLLPFMLEIQGDRYEYEMQMLCDACKRKINIREISIDTVYIEENKSSHFNAFRDAGRVYSILLKNSINPFFQAVEFIFSSLFATVVDISVLAIMQLILSGFIKETYTAAFLVARISSSIVNFKMNKKIFRDPTKQKKKFIMFAALVVFIALLNYTIAQTVFINHDLVPDIIAHIIAMTLCFPISYVIQKYIIFPQKNDKNK